MCLNIWTVHVAVDLMAFDVLYKMRLELYKPWALEPIQNENDEWLHF